METALYVLHLFIILFVIVLPVLPTQIIRWGIFVPTLIVIGWVLFEGCIITQNQEGIEGNSFTHTLLRKVWPNITLARSNDVATLLMVGSTLLSAQRLRNC